MTRINTAAGPLRTLEPIDRRPVSMTTTPFSTTHAVETWDTWFRWREGGRLRDVTVEDTWARVAAALASAARVAQPDLAAQLFGAMREWKLLPDERLLAQAGTGAADWQVADPGAALNLAAFVRAPGLAHAALDLTAFEQVAALAVSALHGAAPDPKSRSLRIGLIGVGEALCALGLEYDSDAACAQVAAASAALAHGCLAGAIELARRGQPALRPDAAWYERATRRGHARAALDAAERYGVTDSVLTAIAPQQRLAAFANDVSDALDPAFERPAPATAVGFDAARLKPRHTLAPRSAPELGSVAAQLRLRAAAQPWIDTPIAYPVICAAAPDSATQDLWRAQALELGVTPPPWRLAAADFRSNPLRTSAAV